MKKKHFDNLSIFRWISVAMLSLGLLAPAAVYARNISKTEHVGDYTITLKLLPAEAFKHKRGDMVWEGGAPTNQLHGLDNPNHHLVAFVKRFGKPVEDGHVSIYYRDISQHGDWVKMPVARMYVDGKGLATMHYGNNLHLQPGKYQAEVMVNQSKPAMFNFSVKG